MPDAGWGGGARMSSQQALHSHHPKGRHFIGSQAGAGQHYIDRREPHLSSHPSTDILIPWYDVLELREALLLVLVLFPTSSVIVLYHSHVMPLHKYLATKSNDVFVMA